MMESCCVMRRLPGDAQVCSSKQASAAQPSSTRRSLLLLLFCSFSTFTSPFLGSPSSFSFSSSSSVPRFPLCFHSSPQLRPREGWTQVAGRPVEGLVLET